MGGPARQPTKCSSWMDQPLTGQQWIIAQRQAAHTQQPLHGSPVLQGAPRKSRRKGQLRLRPSTQDHMAVFAPMAAFLKIARTAARSCVGASDASRSCVAVCRVDREGV